MEKVKKEKGTFYKRPDGTLIAGFYQGDFPEFSDNNTIWCSNCKDKMPNSTLDNPINPIEYKIIDYYSGEEFVKEISELYCDECGKELPVN